MKITTLSELSERQFRAEESRHRLLSPPAQTPGRSQQVAPSAGSQNALAPCDVPMTSYYRRNMRYQQPTEHKELQDQGGGGSALARALYAAENEGWHESPVLDRIELHSGISR
jgi:hypothetical protein